MMPAMHANKRWTLAAVCTATSMLLDVTIVNVALPEIRADLDAGFSDLQWVLDAYALGLAAHAGSVGALDDILLTGALVAFASAAAAAALVRT